MAGSFDNDGMPKAARPAGRLEQDLHTVRTQITDIGMKIMLLTNRIRDTRINLLGTEPEKAVLIKDPRGGPQMIGQPEPPRPLVAELSRTAQLLQQDVDELEKVVNSL